MVKKGCRKETESRVGGSGGVPWRGSQKPFSAKEATLELSLGCLGVRKTMGREWGPFSLENISGA